jgi:uncharacterized membrane protein
VGLSAVSWFLRTGDAAAAVIPTGLALSVVVALILLVTGWLGGELAYRYLVGVVTRPGAAPAGTTGHSEGRRPS